MDPRKNPRKKGSRSLLPMRSRGRPPGPSVTKAAILDAARKGFGAKGFERTTVREVAAVAGVDQSLVLHYFANKYELFVAAMTPAFPGPEVLRHALSGCREDFGTSLATGLLEAMKIDEVRQVLVGLLRAAATDERAASFAKDFVKNQFVGPLATCLDVDKDPEGASTRAGVLVAQIVGFLFARHILQVDALVESSDEETVRILGARLQQAVDGAQQSD